MKKRDLAYIACRVLGIYVFILALKDLCAYLGLTLGPMLTQHIEKHELIQMWATFLTPFVALVAFAIILWTCADELSKRIMPKDSSEDADTAEAVKVKDIREIALSVAGAVVLASVIPQLFQLMPQITVVLVNKIHLDPNMQLSMISDIVQKAVTLIIGLYLFLQGGRGAAKKVKIENVASAEQDSTLEG